MVIKLYLFSLRSSIKTKPSSTERIGSTLIFSLFILHYLHLSSLNAIANDTLPESPNEKDRVIYQETYHLRHQNAVRHECRAKVVKKTPVQKTKQYPHRGKDNEARVVSLEHDDILADVVNPFNSTCYDWRGNIIPCDFRRPYAELLFDKPIPDPRFNDNKDGTVTDNLTGLIWLKNTNCFGMMDWEGAILAAKSLKDGDCGPDPTLALSDGSSAGDWRLPTMHELCLLIDYSKRNPALPDSYIFPDFPSSYYWSATTLDHHPGLVWIVYMESGTTCYDDIESHAGHIWPVRGPKE